MLIGYTRVSTGEQNLDLQIDALKQAGSGMHRQQGLYKDAFRSFARPFMPTHVVALENIITGEANPVDLSTLPTDEAVAKIRDMYDSLGPLVDITIREGVAIITLPDQQARQVNRALPATMMQPAPARAGATIRPSAGSPPKLLCSTQTASSTAILT